MNNFYPDFFVLSPSKCATTSLFYVLFQHPEIVGSKTKETHFFDPYSDAIQTVTLRNFPHTKPEHYRYEYSKEWEGQGFGLKFEITPMYLRNLVSLKWIEDCKPDNYKWKIIFLLRNPVDRFLSQYIHFRATNYLVNNPELEKKLLDKINWTEDWNKMRDHCFASYRERYDQQKSPAEFYLNYIYPGNYITPLNFIQEYFTNFDMMYDALFLDYEEYKNDFDNTMIKIENFLNVSHFDYYDNIHTNVGAYWQKWYDASQELDEHYIEFLKTHYKPYNEELYKLINKDYGW